MAGPIIILHRLSLPHLSHFFRCKFSINQIVNIMPIDTSTSMFDYLGYLTLVPIFVLLVLVYPLKEYIRKNAGSLYSYIYGLGLTLILYLWPLYSFIGELSSTGSISFDFIVKNEPLIIAFIILLVTAFYFFTHHSLF